MAFYLINWANGRRCWHTNDELKMSFDGIDDDELFLDNFADEDDELQSDGKEKEMTEEEKMKILEAVWEISEKEKEEAKKAKTKARHRKPRLKLTERELLSEKGIPALKAIFDDFKFPEQMDPYEKVEVLLGQMEFWAHNLFPSMTFDDCLYKFERLGHMRVVKNAMRRMRLGMPLDDEGEGKKAGKGKKKKKKDDEDGQKGNDESDANDSSAEAMSVNGGSAEVDDAEGEGDLDDFFERMRPDNGGAKSAEEHVEVHQTVQVQEDDNLGEEPSKMVSSQLDSDSDDVGIRRTTSSTPKRRKIVIDDDDF
uniref:TIMELESS-interacting protein n=1 Tax=Globodera rostochiensis TaxID=31243 RepID=A0A914HYT2_GLORO